MTSVADLGGARRDPVSELFDASAREFLDRMYARPGQWVGTRVVLPGPRQTAWAAGRGINLLGTDQWGRPRFVAAFIRACYYQAKWHRTGTRWHDDRRLTANDTRGISYEIGRLMPVRGIIPAGRAVRIRSHPGGDAAQRAVRKMPDTRRIFDDQGAPAARWADPTLRDW